MTPDSYILVEALNQGMKRMQKYGYTKFSTTCQKVKTKTAECVVPALVTVGPDGIPFLMFFANQMETKEGGVSAYFVTIKPKEEVADLTSLPVDEDVLDDEDLHLRWSFVRS